MKVSLFSAHLGSHGFELPYYLNIVYVYIEYLLLNANDVVTYSGSFFIPTQKVRNHHHIRFLFCPSATVGRFLMALSVAIKNAVKLQRNQNCDCF
jgi:hypothetical protein